jgi:hypothetical protein
MGFFDAFAAYGHFVICHNASCTNTFRRRDALAHTPVLREIGYELV